MKYSKALNEFFFKQAIRFFFTFAFVELKSFRISKIFIEYILFNKK
jgi:hypothetical protein